MPLEFVPIYFESHPSGWLKTRFPDMNVLAIVTIDEQRYHILLSGHDADILKAHLLKDLVPPFCRQKAGTSGQAYEPGLIFGSPESRHCCNESKCMAESYRSALAQLSDKNSREYIYGKIQELDQRTIRASL